MNEAVGSAYSGGVRSPPSSQDGLTTARVLSNELDAARFDPLLVKNVAKSAVKAIENFVSRADGMVSWHSAFIDLCELIWLLIMEDRNGLYGVVTFWSTADDCSAAECRAGDGTISLLGTA